MADKAHQTLLVHHGASLQHLVPEGHPERPDRIRAIEKTLKGEAFKDLLRMGAPVADRETLCLAHTEAVVDALFEATLEDGFLGIDGDTILSPGTMEAARRAVGGACLAVDKVMDGTVSNAFVAMRPPGHHAEKAKPMGFCFLIRSPSLPDMHRKHMI
jgi:acetoin utilization deacetylase AcuC-like enzyme